MTGASRGDPFTEPHLDSSALLTIDMQVDFVEAGAHQVPGTDAVLPSVVAVVEAFRARKLPIFHLVRLYDDPADADRCRRALIASGEIMVRPHHPGSELAPGLAARTTRLHPDRLLNGQVQQIGPGEAIVFKPRWSAFYRSALEGELGRLGVDTVVLVGCNYPNCPRGTAFDASQRDYRVLMVADAISGWTEQAWDEMASIGVGACTSDALTSALHRSAWHGHPGLQ